MPLEPDVSRDGSIWIVELFHQLRVLAAYLLPVEDRRGSAEVRLDLRVEARHLVVQGCRPVTIGLGYLEGVDLLGLDLLILILLVHRGLSHELEVGLEVSVLLPL